MILRSQLWGCLIWIQLSLANFAKALTPATSPEKIVLQQLESLQKDDMEGVYEFASPNNKLQTGSVDQFGQMVRGGPYKYLIGHRKAEILIASNMAASKQYLVRVFPSERGESKVMEYWWSLSRCKTGPYVGCYMVDAVIPNM